MQNLPSKLIKYKDLASFLIFHVRPVIQESDFTTSVNDPSSLEIQEAETFANSLKEMGPTFVKFGQLLSTRNDLLPSYYIDALQHLQDDLEPAAAADIERIFEEDLGVSTSSVFASFDPNPMAAASLGQTHVAMTRDGRKVAVKIQRPDISKRVYDDLDMLTSVAEFVQKHSEVAEQYAIVDLVNHFRSNIKEELNYTRESHNLTRLAGIFTDYPGLIVPLPLQSLCSRRVLTMDFIAGTKITELSGFSLSQIDGERLVEELVQAYLRQFIVEGFFHADPHPGNLIFTRNHQIALIDLGMVGRLSDEMRSAVYHLLSGICENRNERVVDTILSAGLQENHLVDRKRLSSDVSDIVSRSQGVTIDELNFGSVVMKIIQMCASHGVILPKEFNLVAKSLLNLDQIAVTLAPDFNPSECVKASLRKIAIKRGLESLRGRLINLKNG
jgi:predicted unusual protein kinase regulating ubiquinone biosynthesis (AarF/ABC1/UbiB family)